MTTTHHAYLHSLQGLYRFFKSAKMTALIIAVIMALFLAGLIIPQKGLFRSGSEYETWKAGYPVLSRAVEYLRLNEIYTAPVTILCLVLFFGNLILIMVLRVPVVLRKAYLTRGGVTPVESDRLKARPAARSIAVPKGGGEPVPELKRHLRKRLWSIIDTGSERSFIAVRNRYSPVGFLIFHLSFLLCLAGGLLVMYTRFAGDLALTEGQAFTSDIKQFYRIKRDPKIFKALPPLGIRLDRVVPRYEGDVGTDLEVRMKITYWDSVSDVVVKTNEPVRKGAVSIIASDIGVSPLFVLKTAAGKNLDGGYVSLNVLKGAEDSFEFTGLPYRYFVKFYPDYAVNDGKAYSRSNYLNNPVVHVRVEKRDRPRYEGTLRLGEHASFDSLVLSFEDVRYWANLFIVREYGHLPLYIGFLAGIVGLIMRLMFYQKVLHFAVEDAGKEWQIWMDGRSEFYPHGFEEELASLSADIRSALEQPGKGRRE